MTVEQARQQLLALIDEQGGHVSVALIEADKQLAANREVASAAARELATEPEITAGEETDKPLYWFPYSFLKRDDAAA
jgi:predicted transcriptional regulator